MFGALESDAPPPPPILPISIGPEPSPPPPELVALGPPPENPEDIAIWQYRAMNIMAWDVMRDPDIDADTRRRRAPALIAAARAVMPDAVKAEVAKRIRTADAAIAQKKRGIAAAKLEARPDPGGAAVIPIRRDG